MSPAWVSLGALIFILFVSHRERVNVGVLALVMAALIGFFMAGMDAKAIVSVFPWSLLRILFGVTFFFSLAKANGTLDKITHLLLRCARGRRFLIPVIFFVLSLILAAIGPGNIGAVALLAPLAMTIAHKTGISAFFMTIMLVNGANAGTFSPFSPTGIIANGIIDRLGLTMDPWTKVFLPSLLAQTFIALVCYLFFITQMRRRQLARNFNVDEIIAQDEPLNRKQSLTILSIIILILSVTVFNGDIGGLAIGLAAFLIVAKASDSRAAFFSVPWNVIVMVCGVSTLIGIMEKTGGLDLFTDFLAHISTPANVTGVTAFITGILSSYSSSSGVVLPALLPMVPGLIAKLGAGSPETLIASINVGSHVVDVSPLSTLGALCIANAGPHENKHKLFHRLLIFGLSMSLFGALVCYIFFGLLGRFFLIQV